LFNEATTLQTAGAFDEGGNFLQVSYGPLSLLEPGAGGLGGPESNTTEFDYHLCAGATCTSAKDSAEPVLRAAPLHEDIDNDPRSDIADIGADEATN
jgi:hypothetical protein